jgi:hypothetical protein
VVAAVLATADELTTDAFRNGLLVPLVAAALGVVVAAGGLRTPVRDQMGAKG